MSSDSIEGHSQQQALGLSTLPPSALRWLFNASTQPVQLIATLRTYASTIIDACATIVSSLLCNIHAGCTSTACKRTLDRHIQSICADILHGVVEPQWIVHLTMTSGGAVSATELRDSSAHVDYELLLRQLLHTSRGALAACHGRMLTAHGHYSEVQRCILERSDRAAVLSFAQPPDVHPLSAPAAIRASAGTPADWGEGGGCSLGRGHGSWDTVQLRALDMGAPCTVAESDVGPGGGSVKRASAAGTSAVSGHGLGQGRQMHEIVLKQPAARAVKYHPTATAHPAGPAQSTSHVAGALLGWARACVGAWNTAVDEMSALFTQQRYEQQRAMLQQSRGLHRRLQWALEWVGVPAATAVRCQRDARCTAVFVASFTTVVLIPTLWLECSFIISCVLTYVTTYTCGLALWGFASASPSVGHDHPPLGDSQRAPGVRLTGLCEAAGARAGYFDTPYTISSRVWALAEVLMIYALVAVVLAAAWFVFESLRRGGQPQPPAAAVPPAARHQEERFVQAPRGRAEVLPSASGNARGAPSAAEGASPENRTAAATAAKNDDHDHEQVDRGIDAGTFHQKEAPVGGLPSQALAYLTLHGIPLSPAAALVLHLGPLQVLQCTQSQLQQVAQYLQEHTALLRMWDVFPDADSKQCAFGVPAGAPDWRGVFGGVSLHAQQLPRKDAGAGSKQQPALARPCMVHITELLAHSSSAEVEALCQYMQAQMLRHVSEGAAFEASAGLSARNRRHRRTHGAYERDLQGPELEENALNSSQLEQWLRSQLQDGTFAANCKSPGDTPAQTGEWAPPPATSPTAPLTNGAAPMSSQTRECPPELQRVPSRGDWYTWWLGLQLAGFLSHEIGVTFPPQLLVAVAASALGCDNSSALCISDEYGAVRRDVPVETAQGVTCFNTKPCEPRDHEHQRTLAREAGASVAGHMQSTLAPRLSTQGTGLACRLYVYAMPGNSTQRGQRNPARRHLQARLDQSVPLCSFAPSRYTPEAGFAVYDVQREQVATLLPAVQLPNHLLPPDMRIAATGPAAMQQAVNEDEWTDTRGFCGLHHVQSRLFPFLQRLLGPDSAAMRQWVQAAARQGGGSAQMQMYPHTSPQKYLRRPAAAPGGADAAMDGGWEYRRSISMPLSRQMAYWRIAHDPCRKPKAGDESPVITLHSMLAEVRHSHVWRRWGSNNAPAAAQAAAAQNERGARPQREPHSSVSADPAHAGAGITWCSLPGQLAATVQGVKLWPASRLPEHLDLASASALRATQDTDSGPSSVVLSAADAAVLGDMCGVQSARMTHVSECLAAQFRGGLPWVQRHMVQDWRFVHCSPAADTAMSVFGGFVSRRGLHSCWTALPVATSVPSSDTLAPTEAGVKHGVNNPRAVNSDSLRLLPRHSVPVLSPDCSGLLHFNYSMSHLPRMHVGHMSARTSCPGGLAWPLPLAAGTRQLDWGSLWSALVCAAHETHSLAVASSPAHVRAVASTLTAHPLKLGAAPGCTDDLAAGAVFSLAHVAQRSAAARAAVGAPWAGWASAAANGDDSWQPQPPALADHTGSMSASGCQTASQQAGRTRRPDSDDHEGASAAAGTVRLMQAGGAGADQPAIMPSPTKRANSVSCLRLVLPPLPHVGAPVAAHAMQAVHAEALAMGAALVDVCASPGGAALCIGRAAAPLAMTAAGAAAAAPEQERVPMLHSPTEWSPPQLTPEVQITMKHTDYVSADSEDDWTPLPPLHLLSQREEAAADSSAGASLQRATALQRGTQGGAGGEHSAWYGAVERALRPGRRHRRLRLDERGYVAATMQWQALGQTAQRAGVAASDTDSGAAEFESEVAHVPPTPASVLAARQAWLDTPAGQRVLSAHPGVDVRRALLVLSSLEQEVLLDMVRCARALQSYGECGDGIPRA